MEFVGGHLGLPLCHTQLDAFFSKSKLNGTSTDSDVNSTQDTDDPPGLKPHWFDVLLAILCTLGICGNLLNIVILTHKRLCVRMTKLEQCASLGMIALAWSDLLFCITVLPHSFVDQQDDVFGLYYRVYGISFINVFIMSSTWLVVMLSVQRYIVLYYPIHSPTILACRRNIAVLATVCTSCVLLTLPYFLHKQVRQCVSLMDGMTHHEIYTAFDESDSWTLFLEVYILHVWPTIAVFLPILILVFCNIKLVQGLHNIKKAHHIKCPRQKLYDRNTRTTLTLIVIIAMAILLVTPAEVLKAVNPYMLWAGQGHVLAAAANLLQTFNFSCNFALYCIMDRYFRQVCRGVLQRECLTASTRYNQENRRLTRAALMY